MDKNIEKLKEDVKNAQDKVSEAIDILEKSISKFKSKKIDLDLFNIIKYIEMYLINHLKVSIKETNVTNISFEKILFLLEQYQK